MNKLLIIAVLGLMMFSFVASYSCIYPEDNEGVAEFKTKLNLLSIQKDLDNGYTQEAIMLKIKYFNPCRLSQ